MDALLFALSFEVVLLQMRISESSSELRIRGWHPTSKIEKLQYNKLLSDRDLIMEVIRKTLIEVVENGKWNTISKTLRDLKQKCCNLMALKCTNEELEASQSGIILELEVKRNQWNTDLRAADRKVAVLRDKMSDDLLNANTRLCYAEKWLFARFESLELQYNKPHPPKPRSDHEERVHTELLHAYNIQIKEREESLEYWHQRYDTDIAAIIVRVQKQCDELKVVTAKRIELQKLSNLYIYSGKALLAVLVVFYNIVAKQFMLVTEPMYDLHEGEMRGWLTFKRERAARLAREEHRRLCAIRIQAWWRGLMVQKTLGQFKYLRSSKKPPVKGKKK